MDLLGTLAHEDAPVRLTRNMEEIEKDYQGS